MVTLDEGSSAADELWARLDDIDEELPGESEGKVTVNESKYKIGARSSGSELMMFVMIIL